MKEKCFSLKKIDEILESKEYLENSNYLYKYLEICEKEYKTELDKKAQIKKYNEFMENLKDPKEKIEEISLLSNSNEEIINQKDININNYYIEVFNADNFEELEIVLPKNSSNFLTIVNLILLRINKEINEANEIIYTCGDQELIQETKAYLEILEDKFSLLVDYRDLEEIDYVEDENQRKKPTYLIFIPNQNGKINFLTDLKNIKTDNEEQMINGIKKLKENTIKIYKKLTKIQNNKIAGVSEARINNQCRIFIDRYHTNEANFVFIIGAIQKKCNQNSYYYVHLENRISEYRSYRQYIMPLLQSDKITDIINQQEEIYNLLVSSLEVEEKYIRSIK